MKWTYETLLEKWTALVKSSTDRELFQKERDALIGASGWTKREFYSEIDARTLNEMHARNRAEEEMGKTGENNTTDKKVSEADPRSDAEKAGDEAARRAFEAGEFLNVPAEVRQKAVEKLREMKAQMEASKQKMSPAVRALLDYIQTLQQERKDFRGKLVEIHERAATAEDAGDFIANTLDDELLVNLRNHEDAEPEGWKKVLKALLQVVATDDEMKTVADDIEMLKRLDKDFRQEDFRRQ